MGIGISVKLIYKSALMSGSQMMASKCQIIVHLICTFRLRMIFALNVALEIYGLICTTYAYQATSSMTAAKPERGERAPGPVAFPL